MEKLTIIGSLLFIVLISILIIVAQTPIKEQSYYKNESTSSLINLKNGIELKTNQNTEINYFSKHLEEPIIKYIPNNTNSTIKNLPSRHLKGKIIYM